MYGSAQLHALGAFCAYLILFMLSSVDAYRPVQHCKHARDNGMYSACVGLTQADNATSGYTDLYLRYQWYRYQNSKKGWHAFAMGERMAGAHMITMYGDSTAPDGAMTVSVRTADGNHPPRPITEFHRFDKYFVPSVEVVTARFEKYGGTYFNKALNEKPTHVGVLEAIVRSWALWPGQSLNNGSSGQPMIWSSNFKQDFESDFSVERTLEMHQYGLGFGYLFADMLNAKTPEPMFGPIDESVVLRGASETRPPAEPTQEELDAGEAYIASIRNAKGSTSSDATPPSAVSDGHSDETNQNTGTGAASEPTGPSNPPPADVPIQQPARTILGKTLRDWMWHLHGLLMCFSFLALYPLGIYLLRRPPANGSGFNSHWTIQCLSSISLAVGAGVGYVNSKGISVWHQFIGIFMVFLVASQLISGWRHHVIFVATKRRSIITQFHLWSGRLILPLGYVNIVLGMLLRRYGWFTIFLVMVTFVVEAVFLVFVLRTTSNSRVDRTAARDQGVAVTDAEAEEYFQLAVDDDDDDDWSDGEGGAVREGVEASQAHKQEERRLQAERLAKLDRV